MKSNLVDLSTGEGITCRFVAREIILGKPRHIREDIFKIYFKNTDSKVWAKISWLRIRYIRGFHEQGNEASGFGDSM